MQEDALPISCDINCTLLKAVLNVQQFLNLVIGTRAAEQGSK